MPALPPMIREVESLLKSRYASTTKGESEKIMEGIQSFLSRVPMNNSMQRLLQDAARTVHSLFNYQEVSIGLKDRVDGKFKYCAVVGYTKEAEAALKQTSYTNEEFWSQREFPGIRISKMLEMFVGENQPSLEREKKCWNRPAQLADKRKSAEDFTEGDYLDVYFFSTGTDLLGWIEISAPRDGKMPSGQTMIGLELFASSLSLAVQFFSSKSW